MFLVEKTRLCGMRVPITVSWASVVAFRRVLDYRVVRSNTFHCLELIRTWTSRCYCPTNLMELVYDKPNTILLSHWHLIHCGLALQWRQRL